MIKRTSAIFFVFLANILLFATVVIPHHHHSSATCFKHSHCVNEGTEGKHSGSDHRHDSKSDCCVLVIKILPSSENLFISHFDKSDTYSYGFDLQEYLSENWAEFFIKILKTDDPPWIKCHESSYFNSSSGLRAPPVV